MKIVLLPQPWASAVVFGKVEIINFAKHPRTRGDLLIAAGRPDPRFNDEDPDPLIQDIRLSPLRHELGAILGVVHLYTITTAADECQLRFAGGPYCGLVRNPRIFEERPDVYGRFDIRDFDGDAAALMASAIDPVTFNERHRTGQVDPANVNQPGPDGWTGD